MPVVKRCPQCRKRFKLAPSQEHIHCSYECRVAASAERALKICEGCEKPFRKNPKRGDKQRFCTQHCFFEHVAKLRRNVAPPPSDPGERWIALTQSKFALVDERDFEALSRFSWHLDGAGYVCTKVAGRQIKMHSMLLGKSSHRVPVDHRNRNPLDNRRKNLRRVTGGQNRVNSKINANNTSGYKGVHRCSEGWVARIGFNEERLYLGYFSTPEEAAKSYDEAAVRLFGEAARTNF